MVDADKQIEQALRDVDRRTYSILTKLKKVVGEIYLDNLFKNPELSDLAQDCLEQADKTLKGIEDEHRPDKNSKDRQIHRWLN